MIFHHYYHFDVNVDVTTRTAPAGPVDMDEVFKKLVLEHLATIINQGEKLMAFTKAQSDAIQAALDKMEQDVTTAVSTTTADAVAKEMGDVNEQLKKLRDIIAAGGTVSDADVAQIMGSVSATGGRLATNLGKAIGEAIDKISTNDSEGSGGSGGTGEPEKPPSGEPQA